MRAGPTARPSPSLARPGLRPDLVGNATAGTARAMAVHARTLEFYRQLRIADDIIARGIKMNRIHLREGAREVARIEFGDFGGTVSPYPFVLSHPQDDHEAILDKHLAAAGIEIEWNTELIGYTDTADGIRATIRKTDNKEETVDVAYLCGCDGANSFVRRHCGLEFPGGTYEQVFYVTDVEATGEAVGNDDVNGCVGRMDSIFVFPIRTSGITDHRDRCRRPLAKRTVSCSRTSARSSKSRCDVKGRDALFSVSVASSCRGEVPRRPCVPGRRRGPYSQPGGGQG